MVATYAKVQYIHALVHGEVLHQFDFLSSDVEGTNPLTVENIILGLASYFFPMNSPWKQKRAMRRGMRKPHGIKVGLYVASLIDMNECGILFEIFCVTEINNFFLNSIPTRWSKQAHVQVFDCDYITFKKAVNMFERMEIAEYIYEGVLEPSYKQSTMEDSTRDGHIRQKRV